MKSVAHEIALFLVANNLGTIGTDLFVAVEPNTPVDVTTLYDTGGGPADTDELLMFTPTFQVRVRAADYRDGYNRQEEIRQALIHAAAFEDSEGVARFESIVNTSDIIAIGRDDANNHLLTCNYQVIREEI